MSGAGAWDRITHVPYQAKRVVQTPRVFANWRELLRDMALEAVGRGSDTLTFRTRSGVRISAPNVPGARLPAYEQFADDAYRLRWFLGDLVDRPIRAIDVGAHVGVFALRLAEVHPTARITCFEPSSVNAEYLERNLADNRLSDRVEVVRAAVSGEAGTAIFDDHGGASVHSGLVREGAGPQGTAVEVRTLGFADVVAEVGEPITFVKLDCEGGEYPMAYRSDPALWEPVERVVLEYHRVPDSTWDDLRAWFEGIGLHVVRDHPVLPNLGTAWLSRSPLR